MHQRVLGHASQLDLLSPRLNAHDARQLGPGLAHTKSKVRSLSVSTDLWLKAGLGIQDGIGGSCARRDLDVDTTVLIKPTAHSRLFLGGVISMTTTAANVAPLATAAAVPPSAL